MPPTILTTKSAATAIGASIRTVQRLCAIHGIGTLITKSVRTLTPADIPKLRRLFQGRVGNPNWIRNAGR